MKVILQKCKEPYETILNKKLGNPGEIPRNMQSTKKKKLKMNR